MGRSEYSNTVFGLKYARLINFSHVTVDLRLLTTHDTSDSALFCTQFTAAAVRRCLLEAGTRLSLSDTTKSVS